MAERIEWAYQERMRFLRLIASECRQKDPTAAIAATAEYNRMQETAARYPHLLSEPIVDIPGKPKAEVFSPATLAKHWGCSERHIRKMVDAGEIPAFRVGTLIRVRAVDASAYEYRTRGEEPSPPNAETATPDLDQSPKKRKKPVARLDTPAMRARWKKLKEQGY